MRFDRRVRPSPYLSRGEQFRLLKLVALVGVVMVLIQLAGQPSSWDWFFALGNPPSAPNATPGTDFGGDLTPLEIKRPKTVAALPEDAFYGRVADQSGPSTDPTHEAPTPPTNSTIQQLPTDLFSGVVDDWLGTTRAEQPALLRLARHIDSLGAGELAGVASREATFDSLVSRPEYYRGRPVHLSGRLRRFTSAKIGLGDDARDIWEAWIIAPDSHNTPYLVYCLDAPVGLPRGDRVDEPVNFSAYAIRRYAYASRGGEAVTTLLMTPTLNWTPRPAVPVDQQLSREMQWTTLVGVVGIATILIGVGGWYLLSDRRYRRSRLHAIGESRLDASPDELRLLESLDGGDPHQIRIDPSTDTNGSNG